jgi:hypothetical protein
MLKDKANEGQRAKLKKLSVFKLIDALISQKLQSGPQTEKITRI